MLFINSVPFFPKPESTARWNSPLGNKKDNAVACYICQCEGHLHVEHGRGINTIKHLKSTEKPPWCYMRHENTKIPTRSSTLQFIKEFHACLSWTGIQSTPCWVCNSVKDIFLMSTEMYIYILCMNKKDGYVMIRVLHNTEYICLWTESVKISPHGFSVQ